MATHLRRIFQHARALVLLALPLSLLSCEKEEEMLSQQELRELMVSYLWSSEIFINDFSETDSIELLAAAIDTIYNTSPVIYPGDRYRALIWLELDFTGDDFYFNNRLSVSYLKCKECDTYEREFNFSELNFGRFDLLQDQILTEIRSGGEWREDRAYRIEYLGNNRIMIHDWLTIPVSSDSVEVDITHINGTPVDPGEYAFDVVFGRNLEN